MRNMVVEGFRSDSVDDEAADYCRKTQHAETISGMLAHRSLPPLIV